MKKEKRPLHLIQTVGEEVANAISHGLGTLLSIAGLVILLVVAAMRNLGPIAIASAIIYGTGLIFLYTFSSLYHSLTNKRAKRVFRIFDHCSIFLLIFSTYVPVLLVVVGGTLGWTYFGICAACMVLGITLNAINLEKFNKFSMVLYVVMGWSALAIIGKLWQILVPIEFFFLVLGGVSYTIGIFFFANHRIKFMHFIWHIFVLLGSVLHYFFILHFYLRG